MKDCTHTTGPQGQICASCLYDRRNQLLDAIVHVRALLGYLSGFDNCSEEAVAARAWLKEIDS